MLTINEIKEIKEWYYKKKHIKKYHLLLIIIWDY